MRNIPKHYIFGILFAVILLIIIISYLNIQTVENFENVSTLSNRFPGNKPSISTLLECIRKNPNGKDCENMHNMPEDEQLLVNFYSLVCRFTGYLGPMNNGMWNPDEAVRLAVNAGCRTFVLEIDFLLDYGSIFPQLVVRDKKRDLVINPKSYDASIPDTLEKSTIREVCDKINIYTRNNTDPIIIVLYFLRHPRGKYNSKDVLNYYSNVAKCMAPLSDRLLKLEMNGGTFNRQSQEYILLHNNIKSYENKILIFSNANTDGFRPGNNESSKYSPSEDLDFLVNLRLYANETTLGITEKGSKFGVLQTANDYMVINAIEKDNTIRKTKSQWTMCLSNDPSVPVTEEVYKSITNTYGITCVPILLFDAKNTFMFSNKLFEKYGFIPKPKELRSEKPKVVIAKEASSLLDHGQGKLGVS